jgi:DNA polymerase IV
VAWRGKRSVVCADAVFVPPDFTRYRVATRAVRKIFLRHTDLIEPLSLDEAYLDVTENKTCNGTATKVASAIRQQIREELNLTASAGVAPNKFLAKIASDWRKSNGLFVIQSAEVESFLTPLSVGRIPGVGRVTEEKLAKLGMHTVGELRTRSLEELQSLFGRYGQRLYELARGIDENPVVPNRLTKSISAEDTVEQDVLLAEIEPMIRRLAEKAWLDSRKESRIAQTVVLKLKTVEFHVLTRSLIPSSPPASCEQLTQVALSLMGRVGADPRQRFRLVGLGLGDFRDPGNGLEPSLFT